MYIIQFDIINTLGGFKTIEEAMEAADERATCTGHDLTIRREDSGEIVMKRKWTNWSSKPGSIQFGDNGCFAPWAEVTRNYLLHALLADPHLTFVFEDELDGLLDKTPVNRSGVDIAIGLAIERAIDAFDTTNVDAGDIREIAFTTANITCEVRTLPREFDEFDATRQWEFENHTAAWMLRHRILPELYNAEGRKLGIEIEIER